MHATNDVNCHFSASSTTLRGDILGSNIGTSRHCTPARNKGIFGVDIIKYTFIIVVRLLSYYFK